MAAALAVLLQSDRPLLMAPEAEPPRVFDGSKPTKAGGWDHEKGRRRDSEERPARGPKPRRGRSDVPMATYRIAVGKRHKVEPRQIVGAIANEGGLARGDFGHIDIRGDHSLVELPAALSEGTRELLRATRISGKLIDLTPETGAASAGGPPSAKERGKPRTKPRTKNR